MDLGEVIRKSIRQAGQAGRRNVASAVNVGTDGHTTAVYSDDAVTIIERDGQTRVIRHDQRDQPDQPDPEEQQ